MAGQLGGRRAPLPWHADFPAQPSSGSSGPGTIFPQHLGGRSDPQRIRGRVGVVDGRSPSRARRDHGGRRARKPHRLQRRRLSLRPRGTRLRRHANPAVCASPAVPLPGDEHGEEGGDEHPRQSLATLPSAGPSQRNPTESQPQAPGHGTGWGYGTSPAAAAPKHTKLRRNTRSCAETQEAAKTKWMKYLCTLHDEA